MSETSNESLSLRFVSHGRLFSEFFLPPLRALPRCARSRRFHFQETPNKRPRMDQGWGWGWASSLRRRKRLAGCSVAPRKGLKKTRMYPRTIGFQAAVVFYRYEETRFQQRAQLARSQEIFGKKRGSPRTHTRTQTRIQTRIRARARTHTHTYMWKIHMLRLMYRFTDRNSYRLSVVISSLRKGTNEHFAIRCYKRHARNPYGITLVSLGSFIYNDRVFFRIFF